MDWEGTKNTRFTKCFQSWAASVRIKIVSLVEVPRSPWTIARSGATILQIAISTDTALVIMELNIGAFGIQNVRCGPGATTSLEDSMDWEGNANTQCTAREHHLSRGFCSSVLYEIGNRLPGGSQKGKIGKSHEK